MTDSRYESVRAAIVQAEIECSEAGMSGSEMRAHVFLAALDAAYAPGGNGANKGEATRKPDQIPADDEIDHSREGSG